MNDIKIKETIGLGQEVIKNFQKYNSVAGISLGVKHYSYKPNVRAYLDFLIKYFSKVLIFINDYNYHWDVMAFQCLNKEQALEKAKRMGQELRDNYQNAIQRLSVVEDKIKIITFFELLDDKSFQEFQSQFHKILDEDKNIKEEIDKDLDNQVLYTQSIREKLETTKKDNGDFYPQAVRFCKNYILDQLIANLYLIFKQPIDYNIRTSPTPYKYFLTLKKVLEGNYGDLKEKLDIKKDWGYLGICLPEQIYE